MMVYECWCVLQLYGHCDMLTTTMADVMPLYYKGRSYSLGDVIAI